MHLRTQSVRRQSRFRFPVPLHWFRFTLGMAQMFGAMVSLTFQIETGVTAVTLASLLGTGMLTGLSLFLYRRQ
jgi:LPXTG-motif cell wall-anchored protein